MPEPHVSLYVVRELARKPTMKRPLKAPPPVPPHHPPFLHICINFRLLSGTNRISEGSSACRWTQGASLTSTSRLATRLGVAATSTSNPPTGTVRESKRCPARPCILMRQKRAAAASRTLDSLSPPRITGTTPGTPGPAANMGKKMIRAGLEPTTFCGHQVHDSNEEVASLLGKYDKPTTSPNRWD